MRERRIVVVGSLNMDLLQAVPRMPELGETLTGAELQTGCGGKGANQARAASRLGASVAMVGKVGEDEFGRALRKSLVEDGVDVGHVAWSKKATGTAMVLLFPHGENSIVIAAGANSDLTPADVEEALSALEAGDFVLCQLETPLEAVATALRWGKQRGATTMLDPAPVCRLPEALLRDVDILTPNEREAAQLAGEGGIQELSRMTGGAVVVKNGSAGCTALVDGQTMQEPGWKVEAVDTTAAGDTFNGALAAALLRGESFTSALRFANTAAALSVTRQGAGGSAPRLAEVESFLKAYNR